MTEIDDTTLDCGKTIDELSEYLAAGRVPRDPTIEDCPECLNALDALARVDALSRRLIDDDARTIADPPSSWLANIMTSIRAEVGAGRELPLRHPDPRVRIAVSEGGVRSLIRATGDALDGLFVGSTEIVGDAERPGAPVEIRLTASVAWGERIPPLAAALRDLVGEALSRHTELNVVRVDVAVEDIHGAPTRKAGR